MTHNRIVNMHEVKQNYLNHGLQKRIKPTFYPGERAANGTGTRPEIQDVQKQKHPPACASDSGSITFITC